MALDGITISNIAKELKDKALGGRIDKVYQPEKDEIILNIRSAGNNYKLLLTASSSHPRLHLTEQTKSNPLDAPLFCMVLRKHIGSGRILDITQPNFERIVEIHIESSSEMGDLTSKKLIIEIMGKHSNIILTDENYIILDSAKHISFDTSSVREVLPGKKYVLPPNQEKLNPLNIEQTSFFQILEGKSTQKLQDAIYKSYSGISPFVANEICFRANLDPDSLIEMLDDKQKTNIYNSFENIMNMVKNCDYNCEIIYQKNNSGFAALSPQCLPEMQSTLLANKKPMEFSSINMTLYADFIKKPFDSISQLLEFYYKEKDTLYRANQKTADIRKIIQGNIDRCLKKREVYLKTFSDIKNRDELKIKGELLTANLHLMEKGMTSFTVQNYYDENLSEIAIPLNPNLTPSENAQKYYKKYNKEKRTYIALKEQMVQNKEELEYLESLLSTVSTCQTEEDMEQIREELAEEGFIKKRKARKGMKPKKAKPMQYMSSDGFEIYVGKNNKQNDELTLKFAENQDIWMHTKDIPGSHVIIKTNGNPVPEKTLLEGANLAAFYSKGKEGSNVPVDYTIKKNVKKPSGAKPGMVIYDKHNTLYVTPDGSSILKSV